VLGELRSRLGEQAFREWAAEVLDQRLVDSVIAQLTEHQQANAEPEAES